MNEKEMLRRMARERGAEWDETVREEASARILGVLERMEEFASARSVALYWSLPSEVRTHAFVERWSRCKRIYLPVMRGDSLVLCRFAGREALRPARFGILEPAADHEALPQQMDLIVVPAVGFDACGNRLGHGRGFYDRLLRECAAPKVGLCFDCRLFDRIPCERHDVAVDYVISGSAQRAALYRDGKSLP